MTELKSKLPQVETTIFSVMSALSNSERAINLSQGFPNFQVSPNLINQISQFYQNGFNQYAPMPGIIELRQVIADQVKGNYGLKLNPNSEVTITAGATQAIFTAISCLINKDDEVIYFSPAYDCYKPTIELYQGVPLEIPLKPDNFEIDWNLVKSKISNKTKLIIINSPHNPTGSILSQQDLINLENLLAENDNLYVLSDEVYEHIIYDNLIHESVLKYPSIFKKSFCVFSFGKSLHATGWKLGYCVAPNDLMVEFRKVHQFNVFSCNTPAQLGIAQYITEHDPFKDIKKMYQKKRDLFLELIKNSKFEPIPCNGTYFQLLRYNKISHEPDIEFAKRITKEFKIASIPISVFYQDKRDDKILRFCFAKKDETLIQAAEKLCQI